ncbi:MAG: hypothetical protein ACXU89_22660 [Xanthobacteraceae bacterium]
MSIVKFKTSFSADKIEEIEVVRETEQSVFLPVNARFLAGKKGVNERRDAKRSTYVQYHDTWADAHAFLVGKAQREVESLRSRLEQAKGKLGQIKGMKPSERAK